MPGPNFVLDKGFYVKSDAVVANVAINHFVQQDSTDTTGQTCDDIGTLGTVRVLGVSQETVDAAKIATGKVAIGVRLLGLARVVSGEPIPQGSRVASDAQGRAVVADATYIPAGVCLMGCAGANEIIDVLLTPGMPPAVA